MKRMLVVLIATALLGLGVASEAAADDVAVIVHKSNPVDDLTLGELRKILMGTQAKWPNEQKIAVLMTTPGQPERDTTLKVVCGMNETSFNLHFTHASFREGLANLHGPQWSPPPVAELPKRSGPACRSASRSPAQPTPLDSSRHPSWTVQSRSSPSKGAAPAKLPTS
jgi:hypothetical protein